MRSRRGTALTHVAFYHGCMMRKLHPVHDAPATLTGDFRRTLQTHLDSIALRDIDLYSLTIASGDIPCAKQSNSVMLHGRDAIVEATREWFADRRWSYLTQIVWTLELQDTAIAVLDVAYIVKEPAAPVEHRLTQMLVFHRRRDGWRLMFDQGGPSSLD